MAETRQDLESAILATRRRRPWLTTAVLAVLLVAILVALVLKVPAWRRIQSPVTPTRELANLKTLGLALRLHAEEHGGKFPDSVAGIEWRQNIPGLERDGLPAAVSQFHDPGTGREYKWMYYSGHTLSDPPETILAAAPFPIGKKKDRRLIVHLTAVAESVEESEFQKRIAEQAANQ